MRTGGLAAAKEYLARFIGLVANGCEARVFVRRVAEGLARTQSAGTPVIGLTLIDFNAEGIVCSTRWLVHVTLPLFNRWFEVKKHSTA